MPTIGTSITVFLAAQVRAFEELRPTYEVMSRLLFRILSQAKKDLGISGIVQVRTKEIASFAEKAVRKRAMYPDPVRTMNDLCGGRVIATCKDDIELACQALQRRLTIVEGEDALERLAASEFGYRSVHFVVSFDKAQLRKLLGSLSPDEFSALKGGFRPEGFPDTPDGLCDYLCQQESYRAAADSSRGIRPAAAASRPRFRAEIQVRSLLQHAWAEASHDRFYKSGFEIPRQWERILSRIAATLETADDDFARTTSSVDKYRTYYGAYLSRAERESELANLRAVLGYDRDNKRLACRAARMAHSLEQFGTAVEILHPFVEGQWGPSPEGQRLQRLWEDRKSELASPMPDPDKVEQIEEELKSLWNYCDSDVLMDYGWSRWKTGDLQGRNHLEWALALNPGNTSANVFLGQTYLHPPVHPAAGGPRDYATALTYYAHAYELAPTDPEVLAGYLFCKLCLEGGTSSISTARTGLEAAVYLCRERIRARIDLPQAFYRMGWFLLLLGKPHDALNAYAKAVILSESGAEILREQEQVLELQQGLKNALPELEWIRRFLVAAYRAKTLQMARLLDQEIGEGQAAKKALEQSRRQETDERRRQEVDQKITALDGTIQQCVRERQAAVAATEVALRECRAFLCRHCWAPHPDLLGDSFLATVARQPLVIVAGGCAQKHEDRVLSYRALFELAFQTYQGTVVSGPTNAGVNRLTGDLCLSKAGSIRPIAFSPKFIPFWAPKHPAFREAVATDGERLSALDTIMSWIYILASGKYPSQVRLLGINGGQIAAFEFRLALAMGAQVGVFPDSGRAATEILEDEDWKDTPGLFGLPRDGHTVRLFLCGFRPCEALLQHRERLAMATHAQYLKDQDETRLRSEANLRSWSDLPEDLKNSNRQQIDFIEDALHAVQLTMRYVGMEKQDQITLYRFSKDQEDLLAEIEHARWNVERLHAGWRLGPEKDIDKKVTPYLVPWSDLPPEVQEWDYAPIRAIPEKLKSVGYEIVAESQATCSPGVGVR